MYLAKKHIAGLEPLFVGGGVIQDVTQAGHTLLPGIEKFEAGTPNIIGAASLLAAIRYLDWIGGYTRLQAIEQDLMTSILTKISSVREGITLV